MASRRIVTALGMLLVSYKNIRQKLFSFLWKHLKQCGIFGNERSERGSDKVTWWMCVEGEAVQKVDGPGIHFNLSWFLHIPTHRPSCEIAVMLQEDRFVHRGKGGPRNVPRSEV